MIGADKKFEFNRMNERSFRNSLGDILDESVNVVRGRYDFAVQAGAVGSVNLLKDLNDTASTIIIPDNAIIKQVTIDILTAIVSTGNNGTLALTSEGPGDLLAAVDGDTLSGVVAGIPVGSAATMIKMTADRTLLAEIATNAFTAGKLDVFVEYYLGN